MNAHLRCCFLGLLLLPLSALAQAPDLDGIARQMDGLERRYAQLRQQETELSARADSLAQRIKVLKQQEAANLLEVRELENQLARSQTLSRQLQDVQRQRQAAYRTLVQFSEATLKSLNRFLQQTTDRLEPSPAGETAQPRPEITRQLALATRLRNRCQRNLTAPPGAIPIVEVRIDSNDTPETIAQKSDFVLDQADRLTTAAAKVDEKLKEFRDEVEVRQRLADFVQDIAAFDPSNERNRGVGDASIARAFSGSKIGAEDVADLPPDLTALSYPGAVLTLEANWPESVGDLSPYQLQDWIAQLQTQKRLLLAKADSLKAKAAEFEQIRKARRDYKR